MTNPRATTASSVCSAYPYTSSGNWSRRSFYPGGTVSRCVARQALVVALLVLAVFGAALPSLAMTYTVTSTADSGTGSLRAALGMAANGDTIISALLIRPPLRSLPDISKSRRT